ncbi:hypothetical protein A0256_10895 [Mucilaginibacter sp. PAMC 26640]|nr:hypothetical protein A0256_10895 [Mucilaginibacter sp. PAMC 26640]
MLKVNSYIIVLLLLASFQARAQVYDVPKNYVLKSKDDYARYEGDIIKTADWFQHTAWAAQPEKMEEATQFFLKWIKGTPSVTIKLTEAVMSLSDKNPQLGFVYMAQYAKYALLHKTNFDVTNANVEAIRALIAKYNVEPSYKKDDDVEEIIVLDRKGELNDWIAAALADKER